MRDFKYLFIGLAISAVVFCVLLAAFIFVSPESFSPTIPLPAFLDTPTFTATTTLPPITPSSITPSPVISSPDASSPIPQPSNTSTPIIPTATPTISPAEIMLANGGLVISGPLSPEEQFRLYESSLTFIAPTSREARAKGEEINGKGYGSPTLICGPLSIAILRAAGLVPPETVPYNFWMLNPDNPVDRNKLKRLFPTDQYENIRYRTRLINFDWMSDPLQPGDFLYIYAGTGGTFEHMLVVNRVDGLGRAYAVTNYNTANGFVIDEVMLYDPDDRQAGIFYQWNSRPWAALGATGFAGFERWRRIPVPPQ